MSEFKREARYIVIKISDLNKLRGGQTEALRQELATVSRRLPKRECVVVESDWPEYNFVWLMLEHRMAGYPVPDFNAVKCAADVQAAQSELAALREELAAAQGALIKANGSRDIARRRLTAAERRNAILAGVLPILKMVKGDGLHVFLNSSEREALEAALKPTESGASGKCVSDGGTCGLGGQCAECPHKESGASEAECCDRFPKCVCHEGADGL